MRSKRAAAGDQEAIDGRFMPFPTVEDEAYDRLHKAMGQLKDARLVLTVALMRAEKDAGPGA